jgi:hypothetical protein
LIDFLVIRDDNLLTDKRTCASRHCQAKRVYEKTQQASVAADELAQSDMTERKEFL